MSKFWEIKRASSYQTAKELQKIIPVLKNVQISSIERHLDDSDFEMVERVQIDTPIYIRLTLPFALILMGVLIILSPIFYMIRGKWGYNWRWLSNWINALGL